MEDEKRSGKNDNFGQSLIESSSRDLRVLKPLDDKYFNFENLPMVH